MVLDRDDSEPPYSRCVSLGISVFLNLAFRYQYQNSLLLTRQICYSSPGALTVTGLGTRVVKDFFEL